LTKGQLAALWGLGVGALGVFAALAYVLLLPVPPVTPTNEEFVRPSAAVYPASTAGAARSYSLPKTAYSARTMYQQAERSAKQWQPDAGLVAASTNWAFADVDGFSELVDWTFTFFSARKQEVYVVTVRRDQVTPIRETLAPYSLPVIDLDSWLIDSHQAISKWLESGGGELLQHYPVVNVSVRLGMEGQRVAWTVAGTAEQDQAARVLAIFDAANGRTLP
jgi:hypothetical protein